MIPQMRRPRCAVATIAGLVAVCAAITASFGAASSQRTLAKPSAMEREILRVARRVAERAGDATPTLIQHTTGRRVDTERVASGDLVGGEQRTYLIAERGQFILKDVGPGNQTVTGSVITVVYDPKAKDVTDFGLGNHYPNLGSLGPVTTDTR
jgi:hypothetical protein